MAITIFAFIGVVVVVWIVFDWFYQNANQQSGISPKPQNKESTKPQPIVGSKPQLKYKAASRNNTPKILNNGYYLLHYSGMNAQKTPVESTVILLFPTPNHKNVFVQIFDVIKQPDIVRLKTFCTKLLAGEELSLEDYGLWGNLYTQNGNSINFEVGDYFQKVLINGTIKDMHIILTVSEEDYANNRYVPIFENEKCIFRSF